MMKNVAISEIGISISGRMAISQFRKKKKITSTTSAKAMISVSFTSFERMADIDCIINQNIELKVRFIGLFYDLQFLVEFIGNFNIVRAGLWNDREPNGVYTIVFPALLRILRTQFDPGDIPEADDPELSSRKITFRKSASLVSRPLV